MLSSLILLLAASAQTPQSHIDVATYYFPGYHADPRIDARKGKGWTEWDLIRAAKPRFEGHAQPKVPAWGYEDESDPRAMAKKIAAAADHGLDAFIFDWYWYEDAPYLNRALDNGFLKAPNRKRMKFALMWANHDWLDCMPATEGKPLPLIYHGGVDAKVLGHVEDQAIRYFKQPNYWRVDGKPYFSIYEVMTLVQGFGGIEKTRQQLDAFRAKAKAAGLPGIHLNAVGWGPLSPDIVTKLGFDSVTDYTWAHHLSPEPYPSWALKSEAQWPGLQAKWPVPYFPNVSVGWDNTPRFSWLTNVTGSTPVEFESALRQAKTFLDARTTGPKAITINSWNEWTEGSYLEPDMTNGLGHLEAIRRVFGPNPGPSRYPDARPETTLRMDAEDEGVVLKHGDGPNACDSLGAREAIVFEWKGTYYLHYDGAGPTGWLACLATSKDLVHWTKHGPILKLGAPGEDDSATATAPWVFFDGKEWHMYYMGSPNATPPPDRIPAFPYLTLKAKGASPDGPWTKEPGNVPFRVKPGSYYAETASPGQVIQQGDEYLMFFSASMPRTLGIARTRNLDGPWAIDPAPILPRAEQIENTSLYFEPTNKTWFLFTNHIGLDRRGEYTDSIWVYWSKSLQQWDPANKAVVLDGKNCQWSRDCIGMPSVVKVGRRLAVLYDAPGGTSVSHMGRDIGLAWLDLPLHPPKSP